MGVARRTDQTTGLVKVLVIGPAVEGSESLLTHSATAAAIHGTVSTGAVPGHTDEETSIVTEVSGPPVLRLSEKSVDVLLESLD